MNGVIGVAGLDRVGIEYSQMGFMAPVGEMRGRAFTDHYASARTSTLKSTSLRQHARRARASRMAEISDVDPVIKPKPKD
jgi:hypothetical protein